LIRRRFETTLIIAAMFVGAFAIWTVVPLGWLWIASQIADNPRPALGPYMVVLFGVIGSIVAIAFTLSRLNRRYATITGRSHVRLEAPVWMRSMRDEERTLNMSLLDAIIGASAVAAVLAGLVWFLLFAGSPLPN